MIKQKFIEVSRYYFEELTAAVQEKVDEMNELEYRLIDFKLARTEMETGNSHAFLLFEAE